GSRRPGTAGRASGTCSMRGQPARMARSPMTTSSADAGCWASRTHSSGPMPAGSPEVRAMTGVPLLFLFFLKPQLDIGRIAQLAQPFLVGLVGLALAQRLARLHAAALGTEIARAALENLDQVVAEGRAHRLAELADLELFV